MVKERILSPKRVAGESDKAGERERKGVLPSFYLPIFHAGKVLSLRKLA